MVDHEQNCIFCKVARGELPAKIADETNDCIAFNDINPMAPVHLLIVPKVHIASVNDVRAEHADLFSQMILIAKQLAEKNGLSNSGYRLVINTGPEAGQSVDHLHMHLLGKRELAWPPG